MTERQNTLLSATYSRIGAMVPILKALGLPTDGVSVWIKIDAGMPRVEVIKLIDTDTAQALAEELKNYNLVPRDE